MQSNTLKQFEEKREAERKDSLGSTSRSSSDEYFIEEEDDIL